MLICKLLLRLLFSSAHLLPHGLNPGFVQELEQGYHHGQTKSTNENVENTRYIAQCKSTGPRTLRNK